MKTCFRIRPVPFSRGLFASLLLFAAANFSPAQTPPLDGLRVRAEAGDAEAQNAMGLACKNGRGDMAVDFKQAAQWFQKSAEQGNPYAERNLALMYAEGKGIKQDPGEVVKWMRKAADQNFASAQSYLGMLYVQGNGVTQDVVLGAGFLKRAAEGGYAEAQDNLGKLYVEGKGVPQDHAQAIKWFRKAADQNYAAAQNNLANLYIDARGVPQDYNEALSLSARRRPRTMPRRKAPWAGCMRRARAWRKMMSRRSSGFARRPTRITPTRRTTSA
jgi:hypothetical protein